jgi:hypothetical protein
MAPPGEQFTVSVGELDRLAATLPQVSAALRRPIKVLTEHTPSPRPQDVAAVSEVELEYGRFTEEIARRQRTACDNIDTTAETLSEIAALYRRVDGQG